MLKFAVMFVAFFVSTFITYVEGVRAGKRQQAAADLRKRDAQGRYAKTDHDQVRDSFGVGG